MPLIASLTRHSGRHLADRVPTARQWRGRAARLVDGTTISMPDTAANQARYPQPRSQKPGMGFPLCRMAALICLGSGAILDAASCGYHGKGSDEQTLLRSMLDTLKRGEVLLGDAFYATYFLLADLHERGIDAVFEQHGARARTTDFEDGLVVGARDHLLALAKPKIKPEWMTPAQYDRAPATVIVRELRAGGKTLVTTLLCPKETPKEALKLLYRQRWNVQLDLRHQNHLGHGSAQLPHTGYGDQGSLGLSVGLQPDSPAHGASGLVGRLPAATTQFQACATTLRRLAAPSVR